MSLSLKFKSLINVTPIWSIFLRVDKYIVMLLNKHYFKNFFSCFRCKEGDDYLLIKFEPTGGFNLKSGYIYSVNYDYIYPLIKLEPTEKFKLEE